jgi:hypothetical protein
MFNWLKKKKKPLHLIDDIVVTDKYEKARQELLTAQKAKREALEEVAERITKRAERQPTWQEEYKTWRDAIILIDEIFKEDLSQTHAFHVWAVKNANRLMD